MSTMPGNAYANTRGNTATPGNTYANTTTPSTTAHPTTKEKLSLKAHQLKDKVTGKNHPVGETNQTTTINDPTNPGVHPANARTGPTAKEKMEFKAERAMDKVTGHHHPTNTTGYNDPYAATDPMMSGDRTAGHHHTGTGGYNPAGPATTGATGSAVHPAHQPTMGEKIKHKVKKTFGREDPAYADTTAHSTRDPVAPVGHGHHHTKHNHAETAPQYAP